MIRRLIVGVPLLLLALVGVSYYFSSRLATERENVMSVGTLGEASNLNPILSTDAASSEVSSLIFQSLLTVDENMAQKGELAESWKQSQRTRFFFSSREAAVRARDAVVGMLGEGERAEVLEEVSGFCELRVFLLEPGLDFSEKIAGVVEGAEALSEWTVVLAGGGAADLLGRLEKKGVAGAIRWFSESGNLLNVSGTGDAKKFREALEAALAGEGVAQAEVRESETGGGAIFLAEPQVDFVLRKGVLWQDGVPFTGEDVLFTYQAIMDDAVASPRKPDFTLIQEVLVPSPHEVVVRYRKPYAPALNSWRMPVIPAHLLKGKSRKWQEDNFNRNPVGTGPYKLAKWKTNEYLRLEKNPLYWRSPGPWMDAVVFRVLPDPLTLRLAFETGQVDFWSVDPWAVRSFREDKRFQLFSSPSSSYSYVGWNLRRPLFGDLRVRKALAQAINVPQMIRYLLYGYGVQSTGIFTPQMWFFDPSLRPLPYDPGAAKALLAEAGWMPGADGILQKGGERFSFTIITNNGNEVRRDIATLLQDDLKKVGIEVKIELYEWAVFLTRHINKGDFDAMVLGWSLPQDDFDQFQIWHSSQAGPEQLNVVGYQSKKADAILEKIRQEYNRGRVMAMAAELQKTIYEDQPYLFLFVPQGTSVMWKDAYRVCRPDDAGGWIDEPVRLTKAGWSIYMEWFYRPEYAASLPAGRVIRKEENP